METLFIMILTTISTLPSLATIQPPPETVPIAYSPTNPSDISIEENTTILKEKVHFKRGIFDFFHKKKEESEEEEEHEEKEHDEHDEHEEEEEEHEEKEHKEHKEKKWFSWFHKKHEHEKKEKKKVVKKIIKKEEKKEKETNTIVVPQTISQPYPYEIKVPFPMPMPIPYPVTFSKETLIPIEKEVPVPVHEKPVYVQESSKQAPNGFQGFPSSGFPYGQFQGGFPGSFQSSFMPQGFSGAQGPLTFPGIDNSVSASTMNDTAYKGPKDGSKGTSDGLQFNTEHNVNFSKDDLSIMRSIVARGGHLYPTARPVVEIGSRGKMSLEGPTGQKNRPVTSGSEVPKLGSVLDQSWGSKAPYPRIDINSKVSNSPGLSDYRSVYTPTSGFIDGPNPAGSSLSPYQGQEESENKSRRPFFGPTLSPGSIFKYIPGLITEIMPGSTGLRSGFGAGFRSNFGSNLRSMLKSAGKVMQNDPLTAPVQFPTY